MNLTGLDPRRLARKAKAIFDGHARRARAFRQKLAYTAADVRGLLEVAEYCALCDGPLFLEYASVDHDVPLARKVDFRLANLTVVHEVCNREKGLLTGAEFRALLGLLHDFHPAARADVLARLRSGGKRFRGG
jgi:5-methylcytosine-specific restriction endonuclease McrA